MLTSLLGGLILLKKNQDNRNLATSTCPDSTRQFCDQAITDNNWDKCTTIGGKECRWFNGANVTYLCREVSPPCTSCSIGVWVISNFFRCEVPGSDTDTPVPDNCGWNGSSWTKVPLGGECYAVRYHCPDMTSSSASGGCQGQGSIYKVYRTSGDGTPSFDPSQCGVQQLDSVGACGCQPNYHIIYYPCTTPTLPVSTPTLPISTPTPLNTPTPLPPNCVSLVPAADVNLNNLQVGKSYSFKLTASGTVTAVEMSAYRNSCSNNLKPYAPVSGGPGTYTFTWTPTTAGPFTLYGRVWNDGILECKADCVDQLPRILCANASACKLTGKSVNITLTPTSTKKPTLTPTVTRRPTQTPTKTPKPTNTPTGTLVPTKVPTNTLKPTNTLIPTNTPTGTLVPTNTPQSTDTPVYIASDTSTPIPTKVIVQGPSPTRIILPQSGVEFPLQILTVLGAIITLAGFLILL